MKRMNNHYGLSESRDDSQDGDKGGEDPRGAEDGKKKSERLYTKKELGTIVAREVAKALKAKEDEVAELKREVTRMKSFREASKLLKDADIFPMDEILDFVVTDDAESTAKNIEKFVVIKDAIVYAAERARNTGKTSKVVTGDSGKNITREELAKMG